MVPSTAESSDGSPGEPSAPAVVLDDGQVVKIVALANDAAIEQATLARDKAERPRVKKFAQMMIAQHGEAKRKQAKLSARRRLKGSDSELSSELERDAAAALARLEQASGEDVDRAYIDALIESHAKLLRWIDGVLRPNAEHREIVILLEELRPKVLAHLDEGKDVQRWLREPRRRNRASQAR